MDTEGKVERSRKRDIGASIFAYALSGLVLVYYVASIFTKGEFDTSLGDALGGGIPIAELTTGQVVMYGIAVGVKALALAALIVVLTLAARSPLRGEFFTLANSRYFSAASFILLAGGIGWFFEGMADNWYSSSIDFDRWSGFAAKPPEFVVFYVFLLTLSLMAVGVRRGVRMQEDVDGLV